MASNRLGPPKTEEFTQESTIRNFRITADEFAFLKECGNGNATLGLRRICQFGARYKFNQWNAQQWET